MRKLIKSILTVSLLLLATEATAAISVVATTEDLAAIARAVGGEHTQVQSLTRGTADPHFAEARPSMIRLVRDAQLLLVVGAGLEDGWLPPLLQQARNANVLPGNPGHLDLSTAVILRDKPTGTVTRAMGDVHVQGNPHYWLNPANGGKLAETIAARLIELDPAHAAAYRANRDRFADALRRRLPAWRGALAPLAGKPVIAYHTSFAYLAEAFDLRIVAEVEPKPGIPPSPLRLRELVERIGRHDIRLLIMEPFYERRSAAYLAEQTGIKVAVLPQSVGAEPGIKTYLDLFDAIVDVLTKSGAVK